MARNVRAVIIVGALTFLLMGIAVGALADAASDLQQGKELINKGDYAAAIEVLARVTDPACAPDALRMTGICYQEQGKYAKATTAIKAALDAVTVSTSESVAKDVRERLAECYLNQGDYDSALAAYKSFGEKYPDKADKAKLMTGICYQRKGQYEPAMSIFKAVENSGADPDTVRDARFQFCDCLCRQSKRDEALGLLDQFYNEHVDYRANTLFFKGEVLAGYVLDFENAIATFNQLAVEYPNHPLAKMAKVRAGLALLDKGSVTEAKKLFGDLIAEEPNNAELKFYPAYCSFQERNWTGAKEALQSLCDSRPIGPWYARARYFLCNCFIQLGDQETARKMLSELADEFKGNDWARDAENQLAQTQSQLAGGDK
ncbi:MAG: tetratricopeptide repeat protein [Armatimonadota bacterium]